MLHLILAFLDKGNNFVRIFFADFSKGFDLVDHHSLLAELRALDVHPVIIGWICAFLSNRPQCVKIGSAVSAPVSKNSKFQIPNSLFIVEVHLALKLVHRHSTGWRSACACAVGVGEMFKAFVRASYWLY